MATHSARLLKECPGSFGRQRAAPLVHAAARSVECPQRLQTFNAVRLGVARVFLATASLLAQRMSGLCLCQHPRSPPERNFGEHCVKSISSFVSRRRCALAGADANVGHDVAHFFRTVIIAARFISVGRP